MVEWKNQLPQVFLWALYMYTLSPQHINTQTYKKMKHQQQYEITVGIVLINLF